MTLQERLELDGAFSRASALDLVVGDSLAVHAHLAELDAEIGGAR